MTLLCSLVGAVLLTDAPEDVQLRAHDDTWLVLVRRGEEMAVVADFARWSHAMMLVEYLRTDRGRKSLERPEPLEVE